MYQPLGFTQLDNQLHILAGNILLMESHTPFMMEETTADIQIIIDLICLPQ